MCKMKGMKRRRLVPEPVWKTRAEEASDVQWLPEEKKWRDEYLVGLIEFKRSVDLFIQDVWIDVMDIGSVWEEDTIHSFVNRCFRERVAQHSSLEDEAIATRFGPVFERIASVVREHVSEVSEMIAALGRLAPDEHANEVNELIARLERGAPDEDD
jgi:hypothetical protein